MRPPDRSQPVHRSQRAEHAVAAQVAPERHGPPLLGVAVAGRSASDSALRNGAPAVQGLVGELVDGRYRIVSAIGEGGMGVVYAAKDVDCGGYVALKVLNPTAYNAENVKRFRRETRAAYALQHPNICHVFGFGTFGNGTPYIAMEFLNGETLRRRMSHDGALPISDAISIGLQLLDGLSAAHMRGVLHRDVKPGNVFLTNRPGQAPIVKLIDFGLAKLLPAWSYVAAAEDASAITKTGVTPGTPHYLSPEQIDGTRNLDERADVWATGLVLYEMLAGRRAFEGTTYQMLAAAIALQEPTSIRQERDDVPVELERIIGRALTKERRQRYANAMELRQALVDCWARVRAEGIARGTEFAKGRHQPPVAKRPPASEAETDVRIPVFLDTLESLPTLRVRPPRR